MPSKNNKVVDINKQYGKTINMLELFIFGFIIVYLIVLILQFFHSNKIQGYEIQMGSLSSSKVYTGIAIRQEEIIESPTTGYVNYFVREGERVSTRDTVYSIDESGKLASLLMSGELGTDEYTDDELSEFKENIVQYDKIFSELEFQNLYDFKYDLDGDVIKIVNVGMYENLAKINQENYGSMINFGHTGKSGYFVYYTDGLEGLDVNDLNISYFDQTLYQKNRMNNNQLVDSGAPIGKLITSEKWSIAIPVEDDLGQKLEEEQNIKIKFVKTQDSSWATVSTVKNDGQTFAVFSFQNSCSTYCSERFIDIEIVSSDIRGLKIPNSSIAEKTFFIIPADYISKSGANGKEGVSKETYDEDGNLVYQFIETTFYNYDEENKEYYVDNENLSIGDYICKPDSMEKMAISKSGTLIGVYNMNKGYADFKQITILAQNDDYAVVSSNTKYGLTVYDYIVLDASSVSTGDFIYQK